MRLRLITMLLVCLATWASSIGQQSPDDNNHIAFVLVSEGTYNLTIIDGNGQNLQTLFTCTAVCHDPVWSSDGHRIGLVDGDALVIVDVMTSTSERTPADFGTYDYNVRPAWTDDLAHVVFAARSDMRNALRIVNITTGEKTEIDNVAQGVFFPKWLIDGTTIAYAAAGRIYSMEIATQEAQPLTPDEIAYDQPVPAPDSQRLALRRIQRDQPGLDLLDLDTGDIETLLDGIIGTVNWSAQGNRIAFTQWIDGTWSLGVVSLEDRHITSLIKVVAETAPAWSPNGQWLAYISEDPEEPPYNTLFVVAANAHGEPQRIAERVSRTGSPFASIAWQPQTEEAP
jgi:Tol biopolymer transport system component